MAQIKSIAITGKGGTGKTMLATLMLKILAETAQNKILAIDADSAMSLPYTLGINVRKTVSELRRDIIGIEQLKQQMNEQPLRSVMRTILEQGPGFDLLTMGRPEEPGCFCAVNSLLKYGIDTLIEDYDITIIDGEAGPEQLNRRVLSSIDILLVVSDMSARSMETAAAIMKVAEGNGNLKVKKCGLILNRCRDNDQKAEEIAQHYGLDSFGCIPDDRTLNDYDRAGRPLLELPDDSPTVAAVRRILKDHIPELIR